jgi:16S rRNA (cytosine967-C5)-methyltransferase
VSRPSTPDVDVEDVSAANLGDVVGRASRSAAAVAIKAHVAVLKGSPMRAAISEVLRDAEKLGGKERRFVAFAARELSRHLRRLELSARAHGWPSSKLQLPEDQAILRYALWRRELTHASAERVMVEIALPGPVRPRSIPDAVIRAQVEAPVTLDLPDDPVERAATVHSFPSWLAQGIAEVAPPGELEAVLEALNREPYLMLRARPAGTRDELLAQLTAAGHEMKPVVDTPDALRTADDSRAIFESRFMKEGRLQVMDLGSQLLAGLCRAQPGMTVVDYCAGAGGKTILLADAVGPQGRVYAWDNSPKRLKEAKERTHQLKLRHVSFPTEPRLDLADVVLVDAPCSGVGTLAREPDQKWKLNPKKILEFQKTQLEILGGLAPKLKPGAALVYGTCSLLKAEDEVVVERFLAAHPDFSLDGEPWRAWPHRLEGGGFFGARLVKRC